MAGAIGLAALSTMAANRSKTLLAAGHTAVDALVEGYQLALLIAAGCVILALVLSPFLLRTNESPEEEAPRIAENMATPRPRSTWSSEDPGLVHLVSPPASAIPGSAVRRPVQPVVQRGGGPHVVLVVVQDPLAGLPARAAGSACPPTARS